MKLRHNTCGVWSVRLFCSNVTSHKDSITLCGHTYPVDNWTNVTPSILQKVGTNLHTKKHHPIGLIRLQIQNFFYKSFLKSGGNPIFSVYDSLSPVVTLQQNFDNLLVANDHVSRKPSESYYLNSSHMLRAHTTAHQRDLISTGLDSFLIVGDVYRRDTVDASHYPVFHQMDGVRLFTNHELFSMAQGADELELFEDSKRTELKQESHTLESALLVQHDLKSALENLAMALFGKDIETQWVEAYFPFTHPSWELEIKYQDKWLEVLGCGIIEQQILQTAGAGHKVGWAFGLGLERLAMKLYNIPDIRLFWSKDPGFLRQFQVDNPSTKITYQPISCFPQCTNDLSFWITEGYHEHDFYDIVRSVGGDMIEHVELIDTFLHPKTKRTSHCYRLVYRHMEKVLTQKETNEVHKAIAQKAVDTLGVEIR